MKISNALVTGIFALVVVGCANKQVATTEGESRKVSSVRESTFTPSFCKAADKQLRREVDVGACKETGLMEQLEGGDPIDPDAGKLAFAYEGRLTDGGRMVRCTANRLDNGDWEDISCRNK